MDEGQRGNTYLTPIPSLSNSQTELFLYTEGSQGLVGKDLLISGKEMNDLLFLLQDDVARLQHLRRRVGSAGTAVKQSNSTSCKKNNMFHFSYRILLFPPWGQVQEAEVVLMIVTMKRADLKEVSKIAMIMILDYYKISRLLLWRGLWVPLVRFSSPVDPAAYPSCPPSLGAGWSTPRLLLV